MTTARPETGTEAFDAAFEQLRETGEKFTQGARKASNLYLDTYEQAVDHAIELELKLAGLTKQEWLKDVIEAQAELARELTGTYTAAARSFLK